MGLVLVPRLSAEARDMIVARIMSSLMPGFVKVDEVDRTRAGGSAEDSE
jgi:hypothetical protein